MSVVDDEQAVVRQLQDREEIREVLQHYCFLVDTKQPDRIADECFTEDAADYHSETTDPPMVSRGRDAIRAFFRGAMSLVENTQHFLGNFHIELDGDRAHSRVYVWASHWMADSPTAGDRMRPADVILTVAYDDELQRTSGGWRIKSRRLHAFGPGSSLAVGALPLALQPGMGRDLYGAQAR